MRLAVVALLCSLRRVGVSLGGRPVLRDIDFDLGPGEVVGVIGPNGSGKTTLIRTLATLCHIDSGEGHVLDADLTTDEIYAVRRDIGLMGHQPALIGELSLLENLRHLSRLAGIDPKRAGHSLEVVGLGDAASMRGDAASFGMARRLEIARLLLTRPRLLLLDEATHGLDPQARELTGALIARTLADGGGVVLVSHDRARLSSAKDGVVRLEMGSMADST